MALDRPLIVAAIVTPVAQTGADYSMARRHERHAMQA